MKTTAQILLVFLFEVVFLAGVISATLKFQLLDYNFWQNTFTKHNVYTNLATVSKTSFESQMKSGGRNLNDTAVLTNLITPENVKDTIGRNLQNFLSFANGKTTQLNVYLPVDKIPANLLPKSLSELKSVMPLSDLLTKFSFQNPQDLRLQNLFYTGIYANYLFIVAAFLEAVTLALLILLTEKGSRFIGLGIALTLSACITYLLVSIGNGLNMTLSTDLVDKANIAAVILGILFPPVISEIVLFWQKLALILLIAGIGLFFIKKPMYNSSR